IQVKDGAGVGVPTHTVIDRKRAVHFVELPTVAIDDEHVTIASAVWSTFDRCVGGNGIRTRIALRSKGGEVDRRRRLVSRDDDVGDAVGRAVPDSAEVRMKAGGQT